MTHEYIKHIEENTDISYDRPIFQLPELSSPEGNTFVLLGLFLNNLQSAGFTVETKFIIDNFVKSKFADFVIPANSGFSRNDVYGIVEFMNQFCSFEESTIIEETDGYILTKTRKNGKKLSNPSFFAKAKLSVAKAMLEDEDSKAELLQKNTYGRNILYYLPVEDAITLAKLDKDLMASALDVDVFGQTFFSFKLTTDNFASVCGFLTKDLQLSQDDITDVFTKVDAFRQECINYLLKDMDKKFTSLEALAEKLEKRFAYSSIDTNVSTELDAYVQIVNCTYLLLKHDTYLGEKIHAAIFDHASPEYKKIGLHFKKALGAVEKAIKNGETEPSLLEFTNTVNELRLRKVIEKFDDENPNITGQKVLNRDKKKL